MNKLHSLHLMRTGVLVVSIGLLQGCSQPPEERPEIIHPVKLFEVVDLQIQNIREFPARVEASKEASISFRISGELQDFPVSSAQIVEQGQLLARLDDRDIKNEVAARQVDFDLATHDYQRIDALRQKQMVSQSDYDNASTRLKSARIALQLANDRLSDATLTAPFSGRIAQTMAENYQSVQAQQPVLLLQDHTTLDVSIQVPENILAQVQEDHIDPDYQPTVTFTGNDGAEYQVTYKEHTTQVTSGTQSYEVTFTLPTPKGFTVYPGMGATLSLDMTRVTANSPIGTECIVPVTAVLQSNVSGQNQVWVYNTETGQVFPRDVSIGEVTQTGITIISGLETGDMIATAGLSKLHDGMMVKPLEREPGV